VRAVDVHAHFTHARGMLPVRGLKDLTHQGLSRQQALLACCLCSLHGVRRVLRTTRLPPYHV
jgi:hypothetical protein